MNTIPSPIDQTFWYLNSTNTLKPLTQPLSVDVVIVGGGVAGLSAAQSFHEKGLSVALLEKSFCGAGASGKSSGFITPDSEYSLHNLLESYGSEMGYRLWEFACAGVAFIENNIKKFNLQCDYQVQDTLVVASSKKAFEQSITKEHETRIKFGYNSHLYTTEQLTTILNFSGYAGGVRYPNTFGISAYRYCQEMKNILHQQGVQIFEETPVIGLTASGVQTPQAHVKADHVILCVDRFIHELHKLLYEIYHVQTFLMMSSPLSDKQVSLLFPEQKMMVWDTDLIYNYFRLTPDNRLMLGGGSLLSTYAGKEQYHNQRIIKKLITYFSNKFASVNPEFEYIWPGLIGVTKDIMPIAGHDKDSPHIYYISGAAGLPWATALGKYSAENIIEKRTDLNEIFSPYRHATFGPAIQKIIGTKMTFALSHFLKTKSL